MPCQKVAMLLIKGLHLMVVGMTTVFAFLGLLVVTMQVMARVLSRFEPPEAPPAPRKENVEDEVEIAVILAAVEAYRSGGVQPATRG